MDESSPKAPNLESTSLRLYIKETVEVQLHDWIDEAIETQGQDQEIKVLCLEEKSLLSSSIIPLENEPQRSKYENQGVPHCGLDISEYIFFWIKLTSIGVDGKES